MNIPTIGAARGAGQHSAKPAPAVRTVLKDGAAVVLAH